MIQKLLAVFIFPLLFASTPIKLTKENIRNNRDYYEVIGATTGEKIDEKLYASQRVIETHITSVSAIRKALADEGIEPASVRVLLYYDGLTIDDSLPPRMWQNKPHPNTIFSPWLDLTRTVTTSGETRITIRIDATTARLMSDLYYKPENKSNNDGLLSIPTIKQSCFSIINDKHGVASRAVIGPIITLPPTQEVQDKFQEFNQSFECVPEELKEPLRSLFKSSGFFMGYFIGPHDRLFNCQDEAKEYYSELYPQLAVRGLRILESKLDRHPKWWTKIINRVEPIKKC